MSTAPPLPPAGAPLRKKTNPLVWVLVAVAGLFILGILTLVAGGLFVARKVSQATSNPAAAVAKVLAATNPDVEIVSTNESAATITLKDRKSGKVVTVNLDDVKNGKISFQEEGKQAVTVEAGKEGQNVVVKGPDGTVKFGAGAGKLPNWIPAFPGVVPQGTFSMQGEGAESGTVGFTVKEPVDKVVKFYEDGLKQAGLKTTSNLLQQDGKTSGGMISGESEDQTRSAMVNIGPTQEGTSVGITFSSKK